MRRALSALARVASSVECSTSGAFTGSFDFAFPKVNRALVFGSSLANVQTQASPHAYEYKIKVFTGDARGAGTRAEASIELVGRGGATTVIKATDGFERSSVRAFSVAADSDLGKLRQVVVRMKDMGISEMGQSWLVDRIEIEDPTGRTLKFPCGLWLGGGGPYGAIADSVFERTLKPAAAQQVEKVQLERQLAGPVELRISAVALPHPDKVRQGMRAVSRKHFGQGGEDAYFYAESSDTNCAAMGVADGVYMWRNYGIDAGAYSRCLMSTAKSEVERGVTDVLEILKAADDQAHREGIKGSSTACIVVMDRNVGMLRGATVGDSGFLVAGRARKGEELMVKYRSPQQEHSFGYPYQLGHTETADRPLDALLVEVPVEAGDLVIMGSDGLFDNLFDNQMIQEADRVIAQNRAAGRPFSAIAPSLAQRLTTMAFEHSVAKTSSTPYSVGASDAFNMCYSGGKKDDITVMVGAVESVRGGRHGINDGYP